jgi:CheY-like chemotaxis protein
MEPETVFVVEHDEDSLYLLGELLESEGLRPRLFRRPEDAAHALASGVELPRLLVLDTMKPGSAEAALLRTIRNDARSCGIRVIVFTAWNDVAVPLKPDITVIRKPHVQALLYGIAVATARRGDGQRRPPAAAARARASVTAATKVA